MHPRVSELMEWQRLHGTAQKSEDWLQIRRGCLTASDVSTVLGQNRYKSPARVILEKMGIGPRFGGNEATRHGEKYEDEAIDIYTKRTGRRVNHFGLLHHPTIPGLAASPDGITDCGIVIEVKCPLSRHPTIKVPPQYKAQIQVLMEVCDLHAVDFVQYKPPDVFGEETFIVTRVERDRVWFAAKLPKMRTFIDLCRDIASNGDTLGMLAEDKEPIRYVMTTLGLPVTQYHIALDADSSYTERWRATVEVEAVLQGMVDMVVVTSGV